MQKGSEQRHGLCLLGTIEKKEVTKEISVEEWKVEQ